MDKVHIHKAKSAGLAVLSLLVLGMGKTCNIPKSFMHPRKTSSTQNKKASKSDVTTDTTAKNLVYPSSISPYAGKTPTQPDAADDLKEHTPPAKQHTLFKKSADSVLVYKPATMKPAVTVTDTAAKASREKRRDSSFPTNHLKIESIDPQMEIAMLEASYADSAALVLAGMVQLDSANIRLKNTHSEAGKVTAGSGNSYFNASVQPVLKDQINSAYTTKLLYDSVIAANNKEFVFNNLTLNNTTATRLNIQVILTSPPGWQLITSNLIDITLEPYASTIIPIRLLPSGNNTAAWQQIMIEYRLNNTVDTRKDFFRIKVQEYAGFKASLPNSSRVMTSYEKKINVPVRIKNSGNTVSTYTIIAVNPLLKLDNKISFSMNPGRDTTYLIGISLTEAQYSMLKKEDIRVAVSTDRGETLTFVQNLSKVGNVLSDHTTAYMEMPLQLEAGVMYQGAESPISYFGGLYGSLDLDNNNKLSMALRSNTIAKGQTNDNSIVRFDYTGAHWQASAGNIQGIGEFLMDGYGARLAYNWRARNKAEVFAVLKSRTGDSKVAGGAVHYELKKDFILNEGITTQFDNIAQKNSGIFSQVIEKNFHNGKLSLITGAGAEQNNGYLKDQAQTTLIGTSLGYNFLWANKHFAVVSNVLYNSNSYPGVFKGQRLQTHDVRWIHNAIFLGGFYEYNFRKQNYFRDSLLYTDVFNLRTTNIGARTGINLKSGNIVLAAGNQNQMQEGLEAGDGGLEVNYSYLNLNASSSVGRNVFVNLTSFAGINSTPGRTKDNDVFISSTQGTIQVKAVGASFRYDSGPFYYQEYKSYISKHEDYEKFIFSPFMELNLLKHSLNLRVQGNYAQNRPGDVVNSNALFNLNYSNQRLGYDLNINGIVPVGGSSGSSYLSASFRMRIKAPFIPVRKFYNLKLVLFEDQNNNGKRDDGETAVAGQTLSLNGDLFVSDGSGTVIYRNTEKGIYKADFGFSSRLKGWIPSEGTLQQYSLNGNRTIEVPYKMSKVLEGKLIIINDSNSSISFNPGNIKVTATATNDEVYSTLTDENGTFHFNLPAGNYIVTLSEVAFSDNFKPVQFSQNADLVNNESKIVYYEIKQKKRQLNIKKK